MDEEFLRDLWHAPQHNIDAIWLAGTDRWLEINGWTVWIEEPVIEVETRDGPRALFAANAIIGVRYRGNG